MRLSRFASGIVAVAALTGCGSDTPVTPTAVPVAVNVLSGNFQSADAGQPLPQPLDVLVVSSTGEGVPGVTIEWAVTEGGGTLSQTTTTTDSGGGSSVSWTLGSTPGAQAVTATVQSVSSAATFTASASAPPPPPPPPPPPAPVILHFDGNAWTTSYAVTPGVAVMSSVWSSPQTTFAGETYGPCEGRSMLSYSHGAWQDGNCTQESALSVKSLWGAGPSDVYAIESYLTNHGSRSGEYIYHFSGQTWDPVYTNPVVDGLFPVQTFPAIHAIGGRNSYDVIAVGDTGRIVRGDGINWTTQQSGTTKNLRAVWGDANSSAVFAVGDDGTIVYFDGSQWQTQASGTSQTLYSVWGSSATDVFAVGVAGTLLHYNGSSWSPQVSGTLEQLQGVWGSSPSSVFAVGQGRTILHYDGSRWTAQPVTASIDFTGVSGNSSTDVFAVGTPF